MPYIRRDGSPSADKLLYVLGPQGERGVDGGEGPPGSVPFSEDLPEPVGTASAGIVFAASKKDHVHAHGNQAGGSQHTAATTSTAGFLSAADKIKLDSIVAGAQSWFSTVPVSVNTTAVNGQLISMDLVTAGANRTVTLPAGAASSYVGVRVSGQAVGFTVSINNASAVLVFTLTVDDEIVWLGWDTVSSTWKVLSHRVPNPVYDSRFSPLGCWLSSGADANISDISGNGRSLTKAVTILSAMGADQGRLSTSYSGRYTSADAAFNLSGAFSCELVVCVFSNLTGSLVQMGSGTGGATNNIQYQLYLDAPGDGILRFSYASQAASLNQNQGPAVQLGWQHLVLTRSSGQVLKMYVNGALGFSVTGAAPTGGSTSTLFWGGPSGNQARVNFQQGSIWNTELTAAQVLYLSHLRLGKDRK